MVKTPFRSFLPPVIPTLILKRGNKSLVPQFQLVDTRETHDHNGVVSLEAQTIIRIVSLITAGVILLFGIIVLTGYMMPPSVPQGYRITIGIIVILYALYRFTFLWLKQRHARPFEG